MKKYISPECTLLCISEEDVMAINSSGLLDLDSTTNANGYGVYAWPF